MNAQWAALAEDALCAQVDPELFFPVKGETATVARQVCGLCNVREQCLQVALESGVAGIWGGTSHDERRALGAPPFVAVDEPVYRCGTEAGAKRHSRAGEPVCIPCRGAATAASRYRGRRRAAQGAA